MKKLMFVLGLMGIVMFSFAGESKTGDDFKKKNAVVQKQELSNKNADGSSGFRICTITQTAKVSIYFVEYSVSCAVTAETCEAAQTDAAKCVVTAVNKLKSTISQIQ